MGKNKEFEFMEKNRKLVLSILALFITVGMVMGVSYALWQVTLQQSSSNVITTGCLNVTLTGGVGISLDGAYPITDEEGKSQSPYEFTLTNTCDNVSLYQINLEVLASSTLKNLDYIKMSLKESTEQWNATLLNTNTEVSPSITTGEDIAEKAYKIETGSLQPNESKSYELRLWLAEETPTRDEFMSKTFASKITVTTSISNEVPMDKTRMMKENNDSANDIFTQGTKYVETLKSIVFEKESNPIENASETIDFSMNQDGSVMGYYVPNETNTEYTLHVQADGLIKLPPNASYYFSIPSIADSSGESVVEGSGEESLEEDSSEEESGDEASGVEGSMFGTANIMISGLENLDTTNVTDMSSMFYGMQSLTSLDLSNFNTSKVTNMSSMFYGMQSLTSLDLSNFNTSKVTNMSSMFGWMSNLINLNINSFDTTNVTDMSDMFLSCLLASLDLSNFNTSNVTNMSRMFYDMSNLTNLDLSNFDTSKVTDMSDMFCYMSNLTNLDLSSFDTSKVTNMNEMFCESKKLSTITYGADFVHKENAIIDDMFLNCPANKPTHESWNGLF